MASAAEVLFASSLKGAAQQTYVSLLQKQEAQNAQAEAAIANRPRVPTRTPDTLASTQYATFIDLLSEGELEGFPSAVGLTKDTAAYNLAALKDIYLNKVSILDNNVDLNNVQSTDYNHKGIQTDFRYGTQGQTYLKGYGEIVDPVQVNLKVEYGSPITQAITDTNTDGVVITISVPRLETYTTEGDVLGSSFSFVIQVKHPEDATYVTVKSDTISGRTADSYQRDYRIDFDPAKTFPVNIRVSRTTADSTDETVTINAFYFAYYQEVIYQKLTYPNSALVAIRFDAELYNSLPSRSYRIRGIKVKIPSGVTVDQTNGRIIYPSNYIFNGTFAATKAWTSDPAWILYDLLIHTRYGFGSHIDETQLDRYAFYAASQYSSALVPDGLGSTEPRFSCNALIQNQDDAYTLINDLCSVMRAMPYWATGSLTISQDKPADAAYLFTLANVTEGGFSYSGSSVKTRHTAAIVSYLDLKTQDVAYEIVEDPDAINKYGWEPAQVKAFACTSRGQAARFGHWLLYTEGNETEVVSFSVGIEAGVIVRPGQIIKIADPLRAINRRGGRISTATTTSITVDNTANTDLPSTGNATISVIMPNGTVETKNIISIAGAVVNISGSFSTTPNANSVWIIQNANIEASSWRVISVTENDNATYAVTALTYNVSKYNYVELDKPLTNPNITAVNLKPGPPENLEIEEIIYVLNNRAATKLSLHWTPVAGVGRYLIQWRAANGNWNTANANGPNYEIQDSTAGKYEIRVFSLNAINTPSEAANVIYTAIGKTARPGNVTNLTIEPITANSARLRWDATTDIDVKVGGKIFVRHSNLTNGTGSWSDSVDLIPALAGYATEAIVPLVEGEILVKFEDDGGRQSATEASVIVDAPDTLGFFPAIVRREDQDSPPFQGIKTNVFYSSDFDALCLDGATTIDTIPNFDLITQFDWLGDILANGTYYFANTLDFNSAYAVDIERYFVTRGFLPSSLIDSLLENIDDWPDFNGGIIDQVNAQLYMRSTSDDPAGTPTWSAWQQFVSGTFIGRAFQFKAELLSTNVSQNILIDGLGYTASFQRRTDQSTATIASGATAKAVTFEKPFYTAGGTVLPSVGITAQNMGSGDYFTVSSVSGTGFTVTFRNSSGTAVDRNFTYTVIGYGRGV